MISKTYAPQDIEAKWYKYWLDNKFFASKPNPDKEPYSIVIPPPNVTGVLHMGHMLNNTIQDVLIRKARMEGKEACWVPGTDHASIATEAKVVAMLKERGIEKKDLTRDEFLAYAMEWKDKYGGIILEQLKKLGASCDWDRTRFTMEPSLYQAVIDTFVRLYEKGKIYRGVRMVNWDPQGKTALSDEEVIDKDIQAKLYYITYNVVGEEGSLTIATSRPETIMADSAVCINPNDERYTHLHGKTVTIPLLGRAIPVILDEYVTMDFGTGCLKVTPAHDLNDYELGLKHKLPVIDILDDAGFLNEKAVLFVGQDRFAARRNIVKELEEAGHLVKVEEYKSIVKTSERTGAVIEPKLSLQWFLEMKEVSQPALENVMNDNIKLYPPKFKNMYSSWMENVRDWCISRQLWWGQQIPAYYLQDGTVIVAKSKREALRKAQHELQLFALTEEDLTQDPDVLDTWFSSWLWPISVFDGIENPDNEDIKYYYPTNDLVTAPEILFFWVARMIIAGYEWRGELPFRNVYLTGIVRDKLGRKMSKSLGNSPDPLDLIAQYGADGVRTGMLFSSPAGNDLMFDEKLVEQGRNFCNKVWNAYRLVEGWNATDISQPQENSLAIQWLESRLNQTIIDVQEHFVKFRISDALLSIYNLIWDDFCGKYLEMIKPPYEQPIDKATFEATITLFEKLMCLAHPYMPFITEEIWQAISQRGETESICRASYPIAGEVNTQLLGDFEVMFTIVTKIRETRNAKQLSPKTALPLSIKTDDKARYQTLEGIIQKLANTETIEYVSDKVEGALSFVVKADEFFINLAGEIDVEAELANAQKELEYNLGFKKSTEAKLANERFVANAKPELVERERQKLADAESKIKALEEMIASLSK
ncbi:MULTISPECIES: valine--tRNA ligase [unclassified Arcicella]|uniref:valine--tRNA ligase n=1 Tax=unclassified Arcicella TaxID=2644986 RepID=UPI0028556C08|nr:MULTISPECIES: valine--tRNA ligase [unclassified Arcicella]MDR6561211.1 valyl-tRNA synthetase [Arcicella sp. BE51]MDR6811095.1 valyl-tRNA synthetase [Arcicella sp. BE140]MDR6822445.1 valyl-tRNA synthetase [Arcicella sp. BE139]